MIRNIEDFTNIELFDEMVRNGEEKQSKKELEAIIDEYNENTSIFKKKSKRMLLKAYDMNWKQSEKRYKHEYQKGIYNIKAEKHKQEFKQSLEDINNTKDDFKVNINDINEDFKVNINNAKDDFKQINDLEKQKIDKEIKLEEKFGVQFQNRTWFECAIEEMRFSTFSNDNKRDVQRAYVIVDSTFLEIIKESVFFKSKMGNRKIYFENIAGIDYDASGKFHLSNNLIINLKSSEHIQLKKIEEQWVQYITDKYEQYLFNKNNNNVQSGGSDNNVDDLMKYAELLEKGLITNEEFNMKKVEIIGASNVSKSNGTPKFCPNCGNSIDLNSKFCPNCGIQLF